MTAVQNRRDLAGMTQAAARTLALAITRIRAEFERRYSLSLLH